MNSKTRKVNCPTCGKHVLWTPDSVWRPFCSERCKLLDLGAWASDRYRLPVVGDDEQEPTPPVEVKQRGS